MQVTIGIPLSFAHSCWSLCFSDTGGKAKQFFPCVCDLRLQFLLYLLFSILCDLAILLFHVASDPWNKQALSVSGSHSGRSGCLELRCLATEAYAFVRAWEREGNYCTAWFFCWYFNSTEKSDPFDSVQRKKVVSPKKDKSSNSFLRALLMEKKPCFPKLISSMVADSFLH